MQFAPEAIQYRAHDRRNLHHAYEELEVPNSECVFEERHFAKQSKSLKRYRVVRQPHIHANMGETSAEVHTIRQSLALRQTEVLEHTISYTSYIRARDTLR